MRGGEFNYKEFIHDMKILETEILDSSPPKFAIYSLPVSKLYLGQIGGIPRHMNFLFKFSERDAFFLRITQPITCL